MFELDFGEFKFDETHVYPNTTYSQAVNPDGDFQIGVTSSAQFKFELNALYEDLPLIQGKEFTLTVNGEQTGIFIAEKPSKRSENIVSVVSYDRMIYFDKFIDDWLKSVTFPISLISLLKSLCAECGVVLDNKSILNGEYIIGETPAVNNATGTQLLQWICEIAACFAVINAAGKLELRWYKEKEIAVTEEIDVVSHFILDEADYVTDKIERLQISSTTITAIIPEGISEQNVYIIQSNPLLITSDKNELANIGLNIYDAIKNMSYIPFKLDAPRQDAKLNAGYIIKVKPRKGEAFKAYIMSYAATGASFHKFTAGATGNKTRDTKTDTAAAVNQLINNSQFITKIIDVIEDKVLVSETAQILNCWIDELNVQYLETNFHALDINRPPPANHERNFIRIVNQEISFISAALSETETENYITGSGYQIYWTSIKDNPQAYKYFTITDPVTVQPNGYNLTDYDKEALRELFRVKVRKTLSENYRKVSMFDETHPLKIPKDFWGQGDESGYGRGMMYKELDEFRMTYTLRESRSGLPAGTEIGIQITDEGVQFFDVSDGKWKNIETAIHEKITEKIKEYDSGKHTNIHCIHQWTDFDTMVLLIKDEIHESLPENGCYQFTLSYEIPPSPKLEIWSLTADGATAVLLAKKPWRRGNGTYVGISDYVEGARVEVLDSGEAFFSRGLSGADRKAKFQVAIGRKVLVKRIDFTYNTGYIYKEEENNT